MKKLLSILVLSFMIFSQISYADNFFLKCERGLLVKENNYKPVIWNFFKEDDYLYVFDLARVNGEYQNNKKRKFVVRTDRKNHLDWIKITKDDLGYILIYHSLFLDIDYMAIYWASISNDEFMNIKDNKLLLEGDYINPLKFFKVKEDIFIKHWDFVSKNEQMSALDTCSGTIYNFIN